MVCLLVNQYMLVIIQVGTTLWSMLYVLYQLSSDLINSFVIVSVEMGPKPSANVLKVK